MEKVVLTSSHLVSLKKITNTFHPTWVSAYSEKGVYMPDHQGGKSAPKAGKGLLRLSLGLFGIFFANVIGGKCNMAFQWKLPHWDGLAEFLLLAAATTMLIGAALKREEAESKNQNLNQKEAGNE